LTLADGIPPWTLKDQKPARWDPERETPPKARESMTRLSQSFGVYFQQIPMATWDPRATQVAESKIAR